MRACTAEIEEKLSDDRMDLGEKIDAGAYGATDAAVQEIAFHLEYVVGNTFRYTMLVGICSFLEEAMREITKRLVADYDAQVKARGSQNWLAKHIQVLQDCMGMNTSGIDTDLRKFHDLITLRNCIVHAWGKLAEARDPEQVEAACHRLKECHVSEDGYLLLHDDLVPDAISTAENIADDIVGRLGVSIT